MSIIIRIQHSYFFKFFEKIICGKVFVRTNLFCRDIEAGVLCLYSSNSKRKKGTISSKSWGFCFWVSW